MGVLCEQSLQCGNADVLDLVCPEAGHSSMPIVINVNIHQLAALHPVLINIHQPSEQSILRCSCAVTYLNTCLDFLDQVLQKAVQGGASSECG
jgi:hypothetical protein